MQNLIDAFFDAYVNTALWSSADDNDEPLDCNYYDGDIEPETLGSMRADCVAFYEANAEHIHCDGAPLANDLCDSTLPKREAAMAGHDFWLTRCGHGAGFWGGEWPEPHATALDEASKAFGNVNLYVGDDGVIYAG